MVLSDTPGPVRLTFTRVVTTNPYQADDAHHGKQGQGEADVNQQFVVGRGNNHGDGDCRLQSDRMGRGVPRCTDFSEKLNKEAVAGREIVRIEPPNRAKT